MASAVVDFDDFLALCVRIATRNDAAQPRPGQKLLAREVLSSMEDKTRMMGAAPTGTGKTLAYSSAAAWRRGKEGERTVISTDAISLQQQLMEKDLPVVAEAYAQAFDDTLEFGLVKGVSNYVDPLKVVDTISLALGRNVDPTSRPVKEAAAKLPAIPERDLLQWAVEQMVTGGSGDRADCPLEINDELWATVSASSEEATRATDNSPWVPPAVAAKARAADSAIIITNHSMLGMQVARAIPLLLSNANLGLFHNIVVDEGHTLPGKVRDQGALQIAGFTPHQIVRAVARVTDGTKVSTQNLAEHAREAASVIERELTQFLHGKPNRRITSETHPLQLGVVSLGRVMTAAENLLRDIKRDGDPVREARIRAAKARISQTAEALDHVLNPEIEWATWVESTQGGPIARISPVNVAKLLAGSAWQTKIVGEEDVNLGSLEPFESAEGDKANLGVALVSATLPDRFGGEVAISGGVQEFESPFKIAYSESAVFIPRSDQALNDSFTSTRYGRESFDVELHAAWCADQVVKLVEANGGSAMVLAATRKNGELYRDALRRRLPHIPTLSQWDGAVPRIVASWRERKDAVIVGTRSLMTGVDAPGDTNSLVIIDRPPRAAANPLDDARVDLIMQESNLGQWQASTRVYATDAGQQLDQAVGRLIRAVSDRGMVAVLDPRLHGGSAKKYGAEDRKLYTHGLRKFGVQVSSTDMAVEWLNERRALGAAAA